MKSKKLLITALLLAGITLPLVSCGESKVITLWVGEESAEFYQTICNEYVESHPDFKYSIDVTGVDTGTVGGAMATDNTACADIIVTAHDNIGKLVEKGLAYPYTDESLIAQVTADNPASFLDVVYSNYGGTRSLYGVPFISQALMLYYNKQYVTPEQATTFEGLMSAAAAKSTKTKAFSVVGTDGFNYSFNLLAVNASNKYTSLKIYKNLEKNNCYAQGDDEVASLRWAQRVFNNDNGGLFPTDSNWAVNIANGATLSIIGGAWHYQAFTAAIGKTNTGITLIPTYTLSASDVEGLSAVSEGTVMQGGTFADCKCLMMNFAASTKKYAYMQEIVSYLSSKEVQLQSFIECANVPAYAGAADDIAEIQDQVDPTVYDLAVAQTSMAEFGIPQPFVTGTLNTYYYSKTAPDFYRNAVINDAGAFSTLTKIRETLYKMEYIWQKGKVPETIPEDLPVDVL
ncbi:MAG TPA: extracellular solute-binding protein [Bacilli bacterium]|nr:extracellular solute-binding protein [Bacilli bacterium]HPS18799.1 extracellular solute-binding protein [Bacilli bacterium]